MFGLEPLIEAFGHPLHVEAGAHPFRDLNDAADVRFILHAEGDDVQLLDQRLARLVAEEGLFAGSGRLARRTLHPLPYLLCIGRVGVDDQVLVHRLRHLRFDLAAQRVGWDAAIGRRVAAERNQAALVRDGLQAEVLAVHRHDQLLPVVFPAQLLDEEGMEVEVFQVATGAGGVKHMGSSDSRRLETAATIAKSAYADSISVPPQGGLAPVAAISIARLNRRLHPFQSQSVPILPTDPRQCGVQPVSRYMPVHSALHSSGA